MGSPVPGRLAPQHKRSFDRKLNVQRFARSVEPDLLRGDWIDLRRGQQPFEEWATAWMATLGNRKPKTRESSESIVNRHRLPRFAATPIAAIDYPRVLAFVADLQRAGTGPETMRNIRDVVRLLAFAVRSGALKSNPVATAHEWALFVNTLGRLSNVVASCAVTVPLSPQDTLPANRSRPNDIVRADRHELVGPFPAG